MAIDELSQELIEEIIDHASIARDDLLACSLSWRRFLSRCQFHLYSHVRITSTNDTYLTSAQEIFERRPILKTYVQSLKILHNEITGFWNPLYENNQFVRLMKALCPVGDFELGLQHFHVVTSEKPVDWRRFAQVFWQPFIASSVTCLHLEVLRNTFPLDLVFQCSKLRSLYTKHILYSPEEMARHLDLPLHYLHLTSLRINWRDPSGCRLARTLLDFRNRYHNRQKLLVLEQLEHFDFQLNIPEDFRVIDDVFAKSAECLKLFRCRLDPEYYFSNVNDQTSILEAIESSPILTTIKLPALKQVEFVFPSRSTDDHLNAFVTAAGLVRAFASNSKLSSLSRISLLITLSYPEEPETWQWASHHDDWKPLDGALFDLGQKMQRQVALDIVVEAKRGLRYINTGLGDYDALEDRRWELDCGVNLEEGTFLQDNLPITSTSRFISHTYSWTFPSREYL